MNEEEVLTMFDDGQFTVIGFNPPDGDDRGEKWMVINPVSRKDEIRYEVEFFASRPRTPAIGGDAGNWPEHYQVWHLVEEKGETR